MHTYSHWLSDIATHQRSALDDQHLPRIEASQKTVHSTTTSELNAHYNYR